ncbi:hypothetical protein EVAR_81152_1 [Eumeta japonica]|uniref:Uncharacterized protein n=1 Tax=Eumeta variegata TaxID=151549 RepID=A0A4C1UL28_EUMVA|nr:hypothetical protein EVAR_81152_1 [Eumeta japonica]
MSSNYVFYAVTDDLEDQSGRQSSQHSTPTGRCSGRAGRYRAGRKRGYGAHFVPTCAYYLLIGVVDFKNSRFGIKELIETNQTSPNSMRVRRFIAEILWPLPVSSSNPSYHLETKPWIPCRDKELVKTNHASPNLKRLCRFNTEFLWPPPSSIIRPWIPSRDKVLVKTNHTSPKSKGLCHFYTEFLWPPSSCRTWVPLDDKVLLETNQMSPNSMWGASFYYGVSLPTFELHHHITSMS